MIETATIDRWLGGRSFDQWRADFDRDGYVVFESVLEQPALAEIRAALDPYLEDAGGHRGRNNFEGFQSNRVYALLGKSPVFADLVTHPLPLAFAEADLGESCLLSACLAINLLPGESVQPWHYDDAHLLVERPRPSFGVSAFWAIDEMTETNGATEIIPGSHLWGPESPAGSLLEVDALVPPPEAGEGAGSVADHPDRLAITMPAGSLMLGKGTLWHRGGANRSDAPRLLITPQYCTGWARQLETMLLAVPPEKARHLPERARELLGYSIHPPFMGYVDGMHPDRVNR